MAYTILFPDPILIKRAPADVNVSVQMDKTNIQGLKSGLDKNDNVNHPSHYTSGKIEVIDFITDQKLTYCLGNAVKYIARSGKKDPNKTVEDLQKAVWYINEQIKLFKAEESDRPFDKF